MIGTIYLFEITCDMMDMFRESGPDAHMLAKG